MHSPVLGLALGATRPHTSAAPLQALQSMLNSPTVLALRDTLARVNTSLSSTAYNPSDKSLRDEVCAVVDDLKAAGWPPERALIAVKEIANEAGLTQSRSVLMKDRALEPGDALLAKIVRWTIECYYETAQSV
jgi:hypothetical protein